MCFHCTALWISAFLTLIVYDPGIVTVFLAIAVAGGASIIESWLSYGITTKEKNDGIS
jgi:hypothetical protein